MMTRLDIDPLSFELLHCIPRQLLIKHRQHLLRHIVHRNLTKLDQLGINLLHILVDQIMQLGAKLNARRPTTHNRKIE